MTMKRLLACLICIALLRSASAQKHKSQLSVNLQGSVGSDATRPGVGGFIEYSYGIGKASCISLTAGVHVFHSTPRSEDKTTTRLIPFQVGYKQNFHKFFIQPQIGIGALNGKIISHSDVLRPSITALYYGLNTGFDIKKFIIGISFQQVQGIGGLKDGSWYNKSFKYSGIYIGYQFL